MGGARGTHVNPTAPTLLQDSGAREVLLLASDITRGPRLFLYLGQLSALT